MNNMNLNKGSIIGIISNVLLALSCGNLANEQSPRKKYYHIADFSLSFSSVQKYFKSQELVAYEKGSDSIALNFFPKDDLKLDMTNENEKLINQLVNFYQIENDSDWGKVLVISAYRKELTSPCSFCGITSDENFAYLKSHLTSDYVRDVSMKLEIGNWGYSEDVKYGYNYWFLHDISYKTTPPDNDKPKDKGIANFI